MVFENIFASSKKKKKPKTLPKPKIIVDTREKQSLIPSLLINEGCEIEYRLLHVGDYIVKNTVIERKTLSDFIGSMLNKRLNRQLNSLKDQKNKLLLIEGIEEQLHENSPNINPNAIRGYILSILLNYQIPILFTKNQKDTAKFLKVLALKPEKEPEMGINDKPKPKNTKEQLQYLIEGFPGIGPKTAKKLLEKYGTIKNIINASEEDLEKLIGKKADTFKLSDVKY